MEAAGFSTQLSVDIDSFAIRTLTRNKHTKPENVGVELLAETRPMQGDIAQLSGADLLRHAEMLDGELDLLYGGPPCQAFSVFGRRMGTLDPRGNLIYEFARLVDETRPRAFVMENVLGLLTVEQGVVYENLLELLATRGPGYTITPVVMDAADYGVPQFRQRVFLVGSCEGKVLPTPQPTHYDPSNPPLRASEMQPHRTAGEALLLEPLPEPGANSGVANHIGRNHSDRIIDRYRSLAFGERDPVTRINKLAPDQPSFAIIVGSDSGGGKEHVHPFVPRALTQRESARMQSFPDWWVFEGQGRHVIRQVGNAVPPVLAARVGSQVATHIFGDAEELSYAEILDRMDLRYLRSDTPLHAQGVEEGAQVFAAED